MEKKVIFIGGTYREFAQYCRERGINRHKNVYVSRRQDILGRCLCEGCSEIVWGQSEGTLEPDIFPLVTQYISMGHFGG